MSFFLLTSTHNLYHYPLVLRCFSIVLQSLLLPSSSPASSPATLRLASYYNSQASTHRADYNMVDQVASDNNATQEAFDNASTTSDNSSREVNTAADLARLCNAGKPLSSQELKEFNARIKAFEEIARLEDRLRALESRKRPRS